MSSLHTHNDKFLFADSILQDTFFSYLYCNDSYEKNVFLKLDKFLTECLYGYKDGEFDVRVKSGDIVIDAGAWAGDFSAYCAYKNAKVYAFEPSSHAYKLLEATSILNEGKIIPVNKGLGDEQKELYLTTDKGSANLVIEDHINNQQLEKITITTLDKFVEENSIERVDFLKADIEGYEREFLKGGKSTIQKFLPKIAICTYHLPDDPEVLEAIIKDCNPNYQIFHSQRKLFAQCLSE